MANQGAKKRTEENKQRLANLWLLILVANGVHVVMRFVISRGSLTYVHYSMLALTTMTYFFCYNSLRLAAEPTYSIIGELIDGGADLKLGGLTEYYHDLIYLSALLQLLSLISTKFWFFFLVVPAFGIYQLWVNILQPWIFAPEPVEREETPAEKKRREKLERKAARPKMKFTR